jgi:hypothetical protein
VIQSHDPRAELDVLPMVRPITPIASKRSGNSAGRATPMKTIIVTLIVAVGIVGVACGKKADATTHFISGTITLTGTDNAFGYSGTCAGKRGYEDITEGGSVTLKNETGEVIGSAALDSGAYTETAGYPYRKCVLHFSFANVKRAKFYGVEVTHRGVITKTYEELEANGWNFGLTLG